MHMDNIDIEYLAANIADLCGIPIRIYKENCLCFFHSNLKFAKDPILPYEKEILAVQDHVGYYICRDFSYYGIVTHLDKKIILGPSRSSPFQNQDACQMAFDLNLKKEEIEDFVSSLKCIIPMPLESILESLCSLNYILNGEKLTLDNVAFSQKEKKELQEQREKKKTEDVFDDIISEQPIHNTLAVENTLCHFVEKGDISALDEWLSKTGSVRGGTLAKEELRHVKNTFIVTITLISRAAIKGGMDVNDALQLSDSYIQEMELLHDMKKIMSLHYFMVKDYTSQVAKLKGNEDSKLVKDVRNYIRHHMSEPLDMQKLADYLFFSRTYLANKFKKENGETLTDFILKEKTEEGKRLLRYSSKTVSMISIYLGFSSQSHFANVFKKYVGISPLEYRRKHEAN